MIFRHFLQVGSSLSVFMSPGGSVETLRRWNTAGAVHCLWRALRVHRCIWTTWAARCKECTWLPKTRNKTVRLNQAESAWFNLTRKNGFERIRADGKSGFCVFGGTGINEKLTKRLCRETHYKIGICVTNAATISVLRSWETDELWRAANWGNYVSRRWVVAWLDIDKLGIGAHSHASWDGGCPAS